MSDTNPPSQPLEPDGNNQAAANHTAGQNGVEGRPLARSTPVTAHSTTRYTSDDWNDTGTENNDWSNADGESLGGASVNGSDTEEYSEPSLPISAVELATIPELAPLADGGPPDITPPTAITAAPDPNQPLDSDGARDAEQDLFSHLTELRARILYSLWAVALAMCVTWNYGTQIQKVVEKPIREAYRHSGVSGSLMIINPTDGFMIYFQMSLVSRLLLAMPLVLFQFWRFVEPALTLRERRYSLLLVPFSVALFFIGAVLGYLMSPIFFQFFLAFTPENTQANLSYIESVVLLGKMLLVFGVCFQVPVIVIFFNKIGLLSRNVLIEYWRHAVVVIFIVVAVLTPTWDPLTLMACAVPPCLLYGLSIWMVKWL
jgi:sec-independent protein translocase protein TatC